MTKKKKRPLKAKSEAIFKRAPGQPTVLTPQVQESIVNAIMAGSYIETAVAHAGIGRETYYGWMRAGAKGDDRYVAFAEAIKKAVADRTLYHVQNIRRHAAENWTASAWMLERTLPHLYGRRDREAVSREEIPEERSWNLDLLSIEEQRNLREYLLKMAGDSPVDAEFEVLKSKELA
jgi:hypothetical protein